MLRRIFSVTAAATVSCVLATSALASRANVAFDGGTAAEQAQVDAALDASSFNWSIIPGPVTVHIVRGTDSHALPNEVWLDANLLDAGRFSWGVVQHEFAHEVDYLVLTDAMRAQLHTLLRGASWWSADGDAHAQLDCERFADLVSWAYWTSPDNVLKPASRTDEGGQLSPADFRAALDAVLPQAQGRARIMASVRPRRSGR